MNRKLISKITVVLSFMMMAILVISTVVLYNSYKLNREVELLNILRMSSNNSDNLSALEDTYNIQTASLNGNSITFNNGTQSMDISKLPHVEKAMKSEYGFNINFYKDKINISGALISDNIIYTASAEYSLYNFYITLSTIALCQAIIMLIAYFYINKYVKDLVLSPIDQLTNRLNFIAKGDYNIYLDYSGNDEFSVLVSSINKLGENLSKTLKGLVIEKKKFDYIMDNMPTGIMLIDNTKSIAQLNNNAITMLDLPQGIIGKNIGNFPNGDKLSAAVDKAIDEGVSSMFDLNLMEVSGIIAKVQVNSVKASWSGTESSVVIVMSNVTQNRLLERMRSEFVANASHELKTPITSVMGFAELLSQGLIKDEKEKLKCLGRIQSESERMYNIIEDILRLAQLETQEEVEIPDSIILNDICNELMESLSPICESKDVSMSIKGTATYLAGLDDMHQLLKNLMENAVKYNRHGGKVIIRLKENISSVIITISDTGIGIPTEDQGRIFERFYRVDKGRSKREGGTGLGLSIVKHITLKYSGEMSLVSRVDIGTTIKIVLPKK